MSQFKELNDFYNPGLILPIAGVPYSIRPPSATDGLWLQQMVVRGTVIDHVSAADEAAAPDEDPELGQARAQAIVEQLSALDEPPGGKTIPELVLGDVYQQMQDNGVDMMRIKHAVNTALVWIIMGEEAAARYWEHPGELGKASNRAERRRTSKSTAAAKRTRKAASTSGTSSRKTSNRGAGQPSPGKTS